MNFQIPLWVASGFTLLVIAWIVIKRSRKNKKPAAARLIARGALVKVWKAFLKQIPREFRRYILLYQPFVVLGESGSGKSLLIAKYTDWQGQAAQFYPSFSTDPGLQIYLGSRALVQEIPATLLADSTQSARTALLKLWARLFRKRDPIVIVTFSAAALRTATPDSLRIQAQMLRGKINVLSRIAGRPIQTRIVLTHMDQVEGYTAFSQFLEKQGIALKLDAGPRPGPGSLDVCLEPFEAYLSLALTTLPAKAYMKVLSFLTKGPATFSYLGLVLQALTESDPLSQEPEVKHIYLTSDASGSAAAISNPFASSWEEHSIAIRREVLGKHWRYAIAGTVLGLTYLGTGFFYEHSRWVEAEAAVTRFEQSSESDRARIARERLDDFAQRTFLSSLLPRYYSRVRTELKSRFLDAIRDRHLLPALHRQSATSAHERTLYLLGLIYASHRDALGSFVLARIPEWTRTLGIDDWLIEGYVIESVVPWDQPIQLQILPYERRVESFTNYEPWLAYFIELQGVMARGTFSTGELAKLAETAGNFLDGVRAVQQHRTSENLFRMLKQTPHFASRDFESFIADLTIPDWIIAQSRPLEAFLEMIRDSKMDVRDMTAGTLVELLYFLKGIRAVTAPEGNSFKFDVQGKTYTFGSRRWNELITNGKIRLLAQNFVRLNQSAGARMFFTDATRYPSITMRPPGSGDFLFPGKGVVDGRYTRLAYERMITPALAEFEQLLPQLALDPEMQANITGLVLRGMDDYAVQYEDRWRKYYDSWEVQADSLGTLKIILAQMRVPGSRFGDFLHTVADNTSYEALGGVRAAGLAPVGSGGAAGSPVGIEIASSPYVRPLFDRLARFRPVNQISISEKGTFAEIEKFRAIIARISEDLETSEERGEAPKEAAPKKDKAVIDFATTLTPAGRLSYAIIHEHRDSYMLLVEQWLRSDGVMGAWRRPFLEPLLQMHKLGLADIQATIQTNWSRRVHSELKPILEKFPFNPKAEKEATPASVEEALDPSGGKFWVAFRNYVAPVCQEDRAGVWHPLPSLETGFAWPGEMFAVVNHVARLSRALWDKDKNPRPITMSVQAAPLPPWIHEKPAVILGFLGAGSASVYAFNQKVGWQTLPWEWWKRPPAQIGLQVGDPSAEKDKDKSYRSITESESAWAFFRLLARGDALEHNTWVWKLSQLAGDYPTQKLTFTFQENPWSLFTVPVQPEVSDASK